MPSGDSYDYDSSILEAWHPMIRGAVDSDARCHGLAPVEAGEFWYWPDLSCWIDRQGMVTSVAGGEPTHEGSLNGFDPQKSWSEWSTKIPALWTKWEALLPEPADFESLREAIYQAASQLSLSPKQDEYSTDASRHAAEFSGNIQVLTGEIGGLGGSAMIAFNHEIASRIPYTSQAQGAAALVAAYAVQMEQLVWRVARTNLDRTIKEAVNAFQGAYPGGHGEGSLAWLGYLSEVAGALALVPSPASAVLGTISGAAGSLSTFADHLGADTDPLPLGGDSPQAVCDNVTKALDDLNDVIVRGENAVAAGCRDAMAAVHGDPYTYALSDSARPAILDQDDPRALLSIDVEYSVLDDLADVTLPGIASGFDLAHHFLDGSLNPAPFVRTSGVGQDPYADFAAYVAEVQAQLTSTSWKVSTAAAHLRAVVKDFRATDDWVAQAHRDLEQHTQNVGPAPLP
ncbi:hypothetical protein G5V58_11225 [Nocardioides anomalus]|uniref:Uncharacterized protein n=1 Tax=Nocardioides anomalus TaxID=2712223 RepID=A0A6G6WD27_9ACTN|nr:hypothetical protein [Nocardioides anomalus]QIG43251.1 hypothetical protein G5V58_11225 [Nocardioides anomalus]